MRPDRGRGFGTGFSIAVTVIAALTMGMAIAVSARAESDGITLVVRDTEVGKVFEMLSRTEGLSIAMSGEIEGKVSISLFDVSVDAAVRAVAQAAGYAVDKRDDTYLIVEFDDIGQDHAWGATEVRSFKIQYTDTDDVRKILEKHLSRYGQITALTSRSMVVVEDLPDFLDRVAQILEEIDRQPKQILLEAKILEVRLDDNDVFGIDWSAVTQVNGREFRFGVRGLTTGTAPGLFFNLMSDNLEGAIEALSEQGRVRALASPRLLTMENQQAEVLIGERLGYRVTTTINQVTTESVEFIESGVILRFTPSVDRQGRILLKLHPEVSTGTITDGIPSVTTTEVTTQLLAEDGERIFIGGLIRNSASASRRGVPLLSRIPFLGLLFSRSEWIHRSTETIVIVKATVRPTEGADEIDVERSRRLDEIQPALDERRRAMEDDLDLLPWKPAIRRSPADRLDPVSTLPPIGNGDPVLGWRARSHPWEIHP